MRRDTDHLTNPGVLDVETDALRPVATVNGEIGHPRLQHRQNGDRQGFVAIHADPDQTAALRRTILHAQQQIVRQLIRPRVQLLIGQPVSPARSDSYGIRIALRLIFETLMQRLADRVRMGAFAVQVARGDAGVALQPLGVVLGHFTEQEQEIRFQLGDGGVIKQIAAVLESPLQLPASALHRQRQIKFCLFTGQRMRLNL